MTLLELTMRSLVTIRPVLRTMALSGLLAIAFAFTSSTQASTTARTAAGCEPGSVRSLVSGKQAYAVDVRGLVRAHRNPGGRAFARFGNLNVNGVPTVFAALEAVIGARCKAAWYRVLLPVKPNGVTGYVRARDVNLRAVRSRIVVDLSARRVALYDRGRLALKTTAAIGAPATPTPTGRFYVNQRFRTDVNGPFGWAAIGISAFSEVLTGWVQGGPVAIHGTNRPSLLGLRISNGCIRVSNAAVRTLWRLAPTGTPVLIRR
jgi:lipoprotein-anchoring transpeptidase ErfK/SrfK